MNYNGIFKEQIEAFILEKRSLGYKYIREEEIMEDFDKYTIKENINSNILSKDLIINWIDTHNVKLITKKHYGDIMREFGKYLFKLDNSSFILPNKYYPIKSDFKAYIYSNDELNRFFKSIKTNFMVDDIQKQSLYYLIFQLLYTTGMRVTEVLTIKINNIDFNNKSILLEDCKNGNERIIYFKESIFNLVVDYHNKYNNQKNTDNYFFTIKNNKQLNRNLVYSNFRKILILSDIVHNEFGPRVHDFRHTMAVYSFKNALDNSDDLLNFLPILSAYLGHKDIYATEKYLHLVSDMYPDIRNKIECYDNFKVKEFINE